MLSSADLICIATEVYNSQRQLSIMQSLSATNTGATAVKNLSVSELHVVKARHNKKGSATEDRCSGHPGQSKYKSFYCCEATPSYPKKNCPAKDAECYN